MSPHCLGQPYFSTVDDRSDEIVVGILLPHTHGIDLFVNYFPPHVSFAVTTGSHSELQSSLDDSAFFLTSNCHSVFVILPPQIDVLLTNFRHVHVPSSMLGVHSVSVPTPHVMMPFQHYLSVYVPLATTCWPPEMHHLP